jgi:murein DD-endopeptidase MepM/ murein hydrolase activator NlpD
MFHCSATAPIKLAATSVVMAMVLPASALATPTPAPPSPSSSQTATVDPDRLKQLESELAESSKAVAEAQRALEQTEAEFQAVTTAVERANDQLATAAAADATSQQQLAVAEQKAAKVDRELAAVQEQVGAARDTLGRLARDAYQYGTHSPMAVALDAESPRDFATRLIGVQTVLRAENTALAQLAVDRADLRNSQDRLHAVRTELTMLRTRAAERLTEKQAAHARATAAQASLDEVRQRRAHALTVAEQAREQDKAEHAEFLRQSAEIARAIQQRGAPPPPASVTVVPAPETAAAGPAVATGSFVRPGTGSLSSPFGMRLHPILGYTKLHTGADLSVGDGWVYAADTGVVLKAEFNSAYGNMSVIDHGASGVTTLYAHQATMQVRVGDRVTKGQRIGRIGSTGYSTGPHLHFEVRLNGQPVDPWPYIKDAPLP